MKRLACAATVGLLAVLALSSTSPAATITEVLAQQFNPTQYDFYTSGYGHSGYYLTWSNVDPVTNQFLGGRPGPGLSNPSANNPSWLNFSTTSTGNNLNGSGSGNTTGSSAAPQFWSLFKLGDNTGQAWSMDFSVLLYDPSFKGADVAVELAGSVNGTNDYKARDLVTADVNDGTMIKYHIVAAAGETVDVQITANGGETYAAGFFMDNYDVSVYGGGLVPEPTTMLLLLAGAGGLILKRRHR